MSIEARTGSPDEPPLIQLLGPLAINGSTLAGLHSDQERWLLAYLILGPDRERSRSELAALFWPDLLDGPDYLTHGLSRLRRALQECGLDGSVPRGSRGSPVRFDTRDARIDVREFEKASRDGNAHLARELYRGPLMFNVSDVNLAPEARAWAAWERARLEMMLHAVMRDVPAVRGTWSRLRRLHEVERNRLLGRPHERHLADRWADPEESPGKLGWFQRLERDAARAWAGPPSAAFPPVLDQEELEAAGGAVGLESRFYVERPADAQFHAALARSDSVVLLRGPRQVGKTSLLARGLQRRREAGTRTACTDLQRLSAAELESTEALLQAFARSLIRQLRLDLRMAEFWDPGESAATNFETLLLAALEQDKTPLLWGLDEVDRLFGCSFRGEVFGLFRSWHNARALEPLAGWSRLTLAVTYSTEPHLFITDPNQSPFNVGTKVTLEDFTRDQVRDLNQRYGAPLRDTQELDRFYALVGGHPYLVQQGLREMAARGSEIAELEGGAAREGSIFGDHLRRVLDMLTRDPSLSEAVRAVLRGEPCPRESFERLRSAGVLAGDAAAEARPRCGLYASYLGERML